MPPSRSTSQHIEDHLGQAEFSLKVAKNFACLEGTPAQDAVRTALARIDEARKWVRHNLQPAPTVHPATPASPAARERCRIVIRRMSRLAP